METDIRTGEFDCCILDRASLLDNQDALRTRKQADRIPLPVVLLVPEQRADEVVNALQRESNALDSLVDELLRMPITSLELEQRFKSVLRARNQAIRLHEGHEQLELLNRVLRHDIRNDMSVVLGWLEVLDPHVDSEGKEILDRVLNSGHHVVELTDIARNIVEAIFEGEGPSLEPVELGGLLENVIAIRKETFEKATITLQGPPPDVTVLANEMLSSVFRNLINNAVQHNDADEPSVSISTQEDDDNVRIRIADNGPGISEEHRDRIFDSDVKGLESIGTGMGLYLVTNLVEMYDGSVWIEDNDPRGVVFVVELPTIDSTMGDGNG
ncbi:sensor histidine kinase [Halalkaliarchaeum desulfuricum]|uniref:sensor histidine kinase n=1 Tax=Halalkaliarchaeum desulfuricum TaxID=2055893 RepID=UPI00137B07A6|nr:HAMP domain-containing sensor histidine kinase [Halalkaliarchaeum desulfuricum]